MGRAHELRADLQALVSAIAAAQRATSDSREQKLSADCLDLARLHLGYLDALLEGKSRVLEDRVYLGVYSLNKGFIEIGGEWQNSPECLRLVTLVIDKAYDFYKETRPAIK